MLSRIKDAFRKFLVGSSKSPADAQLERLGLNVVSDGILVQRIRDINKTIELMYDLEPEEKIKACDMLVKMVATAWMRAGNNRYAASMLIHWEHLIKYAQWVAQVLKKEQRKEGMIGEIDLTDKVVLSNLKDQVNRVLDIMLTPYAKMVVDVSFNAPDVAPQFIAVIREQPSLFKTPGGQIPPMYEGEIGGVETTREEEGE